MSVGPEVYGRVFQGHPEGDAVLQDLVARFYDRPSFVPGGVEGQRQTEFNEGQRSVVMFILRRIGQINDTENDDEA